MENTHTTTKRPDSAAERQRRCRANAKAHTERLECQVVNLQQEIAALRELLSNKEMPPPSEPETFDGFGAHVQRLQQLIIRLRGAAELRSIEND